MRVAPETDTVAVGVRDIVSNVTGLARHELSASSAAPDG